MDTPDLAKVPRKVWFGAVGIAAGATAIKVWKNRQSPPSTQSAEGVDANSTSDATYGSLTGSTDYPISGSTPLISPVVISGDSQSGSGTDAGALQAMYLDAASGLFGAYENMLGPLMSTQQQMMLGQNDALMGIIMAGGIPSGQGQVQTVAPPAAPTAAAIPAAAAAPKFKTVYENRTRDNGKSGAKRLVWCSRVTIHRYPDGRGVVVGETKIKNGKC